MLCHMFDLQDIKYNDREINMGGIVVFVRMI